MSVYRPRYKDPKSGEMRQSKVWWFEFTLAGKRVRETTNTSRKTLAVEAQKRRRLQLEGALSGMPSEGSTDRIASVEERVKKYLDHYPSNHRATSVVFSKQRLTHVRRILGAYLLCDLTEDRIREYIQKRLLEGAGGRTINMEIGELSRALRFKWSVVWPNVRKLEENHDVGRALSPEEETRLLRAAAEDPSPNRNRMLYTFLRIALTTGMRCGEIVSLRWDQIDFAAEAITVGRAKTKAGSGRQIPMNSDLKAALDMHASWYSERFGECRLNWCVFPGRTGRPKLGETRPLDPAIPSRSINSSWNG